VRLAWAWLTALSACGRLGFDAVAPPAGPQLGDGSRPDIVFQTNVAFVTKAVITPGMLGGIGAADVLCQQAADQAVLPGSYVAWLSATGQNAIDRIAGSRGWVRTDNTPVADTPADLVAGNMLAPISLTADGTEEVFDDPVVVTGTLGDGTAFGTCSEWTQTTSSACTTGRLNATAKQWTSVNSSSATACAGPSRIYCFGTGHQLPVAPTGVTGRRAFMSTAVTSGGGVAAFDARCMADATAAQLPGTYRALVATASQRAIDRFDTSGARWERLDGIPLAPTAGSLALGLRVPLEQRADGTYDTGTAQVWTGATDPGSLAAGSACVDWTSASPSQQGLLGEPHRAGTEGFDLSSRRCDDTTHGVYCLEL
jgi:hypothetical protein